MSSGAVGPRPPPVTRCCSAPTQAAPSGSDHSLAPGLHSGLLLITRDIPGPTLSRVGPGLRTPPAATSGRAIYLMDLWGQRPQALANATRPEPEWETHWPGWAELGSGRGARMEWGSERKGWETLGRFWECIWGKTNQGGCEWLERWKRKEPRASRPWAGSECQ